MGSSRNTLGASSLEGARKSRKPSRETHGVLSTIDGRYGVRVSR